MIVNCTGQVKVHCKLRQQNLIVHLSILRMSGKELQKELDVVALFS